MVFAWAWWPVFQVLGVRWSQDPQYSHGYFVPFIAAYILWIRLSKVSRTSSHPAWTGLLLVASGAVAYLLGAHLYFEWLEHISMLPILMGISLLLGGRWLFRVCLPAVAYLAFMIPMPYSLETAMAMPLQSLAGRCSEFLLQTMGIAAIRNGNLIRVEEHVLGVAEACSGMRMLVVFFAVSAAIALVVERNWIEKLFVILSAVPIALFCNVVRITVTGVLYSVAGRELAEKVFHDVAGWLMMPAALGLVCAELKYLSLVFPAHSGQYAFSRPAIVPANPATSSGGVA
ncbi:MAG: exosortase/archaeosortase family protein [Planctomycetaceae bacterium]|nr:exosortase/archaeosortase family protein [Planctomycetaceae bacterium]